jgi:hypothetical protein
MLGAADIKDEYPGTSDVVLVACVIGLTVAAWVVAVVLFVRHWQGGWKRLWTLPLVVIAGLFFFPILFLLFSKSVRRNVLPVKPE